MVAECSQAKGGFLEPRGASANSEGSERPRAAGGTYGGTGGLEPGGRTRLVHEGLNKHATSACRDLSTFKNGTWVFWGQNKRNAGDKLEVRQIWKICWSVFWRFP